MPGRRRLNGRMIKVIREDLKETGLIPIFGVRSFTPQTRCHDIHGELPADTAHFCPICFRTGAETEQVIDGLKTRPPTEPTNPDIRAQYPTHRDAMRNFAQDDRDHGRKPFPKKDRVDPEACCPICGEVLDGNVSGGTMESVAALQELMRLVRQHPELADSVDVALKWDAHVCKGGPCRSDKGTS